MRNLLHSDDEYFKLCVFETLGNIKDDDMDQMCIIGNGEDCNYEYTYTSEFYGEKKLIVDVKPKEYPCILIWGEKEILGESVYIGDFVYQSDFNK